MVDKFYIFGNIGRVTEVPKSGGQSSARRVIKGLNEMGYEIEPIVRRRCVMEGGKAVHFFETWTFALIDLLKILKHTISGNRKSSSFLMLTYGGGLVPYEFIISAFMRLSGYKSVIYMKGGQFVDFFNRGSSLYRWLAKKTMDYQDQAWFEVMPSLDLVKKISNTHLVYIPNYIEDENIAEIEPQKPTDRLNMIYFGRVTPEKNVDVIIKAFNMLCEKYDDVYLTIIGGAGYSSAYVKEVDELIVASPYTHHITRKGVTPFAEIKEIMRTQHIFVFPSRERAEGHSNSLNEAMAQGVIPVVSDHHFNKDIVGNDLLVVKGFEPKAYAEKIAFIRQNCDLNELSVKMWKRVKDNYSSSVITPRIYEELKKLN